MNYTRPCDYHSVSLNHIEFYFPKVTPLTNTVLILIRGFCNCYSLTGGWHSRGWMLKILVAALANGSLIHHDGYTKIRHMYLHR